MKIHRNIHIFVKSQNFKNGSSDPDRLLAQNFEKYTSPAQILMYFLYRIPLWIPGNVWKHNIQTRKQLPGREAPREGCFLVFMLCFHTFPGIHKGILYRKYIRICGRGCRKYIRIYIISPPKCGLIYTINRTIHDRK